MKEQLIKYVKEIKNTSIFNEKRNFYITKYSIIIGILLIFALFSDVFSFSYFFGFFFFLGFLLTLDLMITFLKKGGSSKTNKSESEVALYEKIFILIQVIAFALCANDIMPYIIKSIFGVSAIIGITYLTLEMIREHSENKTIQRGKYVKYAPLVFLPIMFIPPFPLIFMIIYHILYFIMIPSIILTMIYIVIDIMHQIRLSLVIASFICLYGFLMLCL